MVLDVRVKVNPHYAREDWRISAFQPWFGMETRLLPDLAATHAFGLELGEAAHPGQIIGLTGELGAGKTHLAKGIVAGLGCASEVTSPTFTLVHEYRGGRLPVFHLDFYRLVAPGELHGLGWDDILDENGVVIVEWADKFPGLLPADTLWVALAAPSHGVRSATIRGDHPSTP
jgi:tRNA threonylcarbamoyladenosine biosynthesis protein TsaE